MTDILDAEKLEAALKRAAAVWSDEAKSGLIMAAARAYLATLPRWKDVEIEASIVVDAQGRAGAFLFHDHASAIDAARERGQGAQAVRLTGTAKVRA